MCQTARGERIALACSDRIEAGTEIEFDLTVLDISGINEELIREILSYGQFQGLGCWRGGSFGRFSLESLEGVGAVQLQKKIKKTGHKKTA
jgi:hypothetical protein